MSSSRRQPDWPGEPCLGDTLARLPARRAAVVVLVALTVNLSFLCLLGAGARLAEDVTVEFVIEDEPTVTDCCPVGDEDWRFGRGRRRAVGARESEPEPSVGAARSITGIDPEARGLEPELAASPLVGFGPGRWGAITDCGPPPPDPYSHPGGFCRVRCPPNRQAWSGCGFGLSERSLPAPVVAAEHRRIPNGGRRSTDGGINDVRVAGNIVFVVDRSGSMDAVGDFVKNDLARAVNRLNSTQRFNVVWFSDGDPDAFDRGMVRADEDNKQRFYRYLGEVKFHGSTDPRAAVFRAMELRPDVVWVLTDGNFEPELTEAILHRNAHRIRFHVREFVMPGGQGHT